MSVRVVMEFPDNDRITPELRAMAAKELFRVVMPDTPVYQPSMVAYQVVEGGQWGLLHEVET